MKVEEEDSDDSLLCPDQHPLPDPLTFLSVEQALDLVSLLSYHLARNNCINLNTNFPNAESLSKIDENPEIQVCSNEKDKETEVDDKISTSKENILLIPKESISSILKEKVTSISKENVSSITKDNTFSIPKIVTSEDEIKLEEKKEGNSEIDVTKFTDEICKEKFDELKKLLSDAHQAVSNIVSSQESLVCETVDENVKNFINKASTESDSMETYGSISSLEVWSTPNISRSNSDSGLRAGKYHKKPAPKVPTTDSLENDDTESQKALKATLVIKTGTIKSFTDSIDSKKLKRKKPSKTRPKEGFSKLLTVPKNFFHNAFHKDHKDKVKYDDSSSINSDCSDSGSRSSSIGSQNTPTDDDTLTPSSDIESEKFIPNDDKQKTDQDDVNLENKNELSKTDEKFVDKNVVSSMEKITDASKYEEEAKETKNVEDNENDQIFRARLRIREMSRSPNRCSRKSYSEE